MNKIKVLFVCLGNICRSPAAEAIFKKLLIEKNLSHLFEVDSAGTSGHHVGELADERMRKAAYSRGIEIASRSRKLMTRDLVNFNYVIAMDDSNYDNILLQSDSLEEVCNVFKMKDFFPQKFQDIDEVPDPYYGGREGFDFVLNLLEFSSGSLLSKILKDTEELKPQYPCDR